MCKINCSGGCPQCSPEDHKKTPHKHAALIKAWADGATIQYYDKYITGTWIVANMPTWSTENDYRIKPEPGPDVVRYSNMTRLGSLNTSIGPFPGSNMKSTFDGETGELKSVVMFQYTWE